MTDELKVSLANTLGGCVCDGDCDCYENTLEVRVNGRARFGLALWAFCPKSQKEGWQVVIHGRALFSEHPDLLGAQIKRHLLDKSLTTDAMRPLLRENGCESQS